MKILTLMLKRRKKSQTWHHISLAIRNKYLLQPEECFSPPMGGEGGVGWGEGRGEKRGEKSEMIVLTFSHNIENKNFRLSNNFAVYRKNSLVCWESKFYKNACVSAFPLVMSAHPIRPMTSFKCLLYVKSNLVKKVLPLACIWEDPSVILWKTRSRLTFPPAQFYKT